MKLNSFNFVLKINFETKPHLYNLKILQQQQQNFSFNRINKINNIENQIKY